MKKCEKCKIDKEEIFFSKNQRWCKSCFKEYREINKEKRQIYGYNYWRKNKEKLTVYHKNNRAENIDKIKERDKNYRHNNKKESTPESRAKNNQYNKNRKNNDLAFKIRNGVSKTISAMLKANGTSFD